MNGSNINISVSTCTCTALKIDVGGMFAISLQKKYILN